MSLYVDIEKRFGGFCLQTKFETGEETLALLGASGCGKTLTLKCIAGIEKPDRGRIVIDGVTVFDSEKRINLPPQQRRTGLLFQNYALFPNMTVLENIRAGAKREKDREKRAASVAAIMDSFGLLDVAGHYPHQLSGGQQQRTALARILVSDPQILLLDEPFSALDSHLRFRLEQQLRQVLEKFGKTALLVSHDRDEVFRLADRVALMEQGHISVIGTGKEVFADPVTVGGAALTGCQNISPVRRVDDTHAEALDWGITLTLSQCAEDVTAVGIRMHSVRPGQGENSFRCRVTEVIENPFSVTVMVQAAENAMPFAMELSKAEWKEIDDNYVYVNINPEEILLLRDL